MIIKDFNQDDFENIISNNKVILDFYADWCGPCKMLSKVLDEFILNNKDLIILKINVDKHINLAKKYGVMTIPTLVLYENGKLVKKNMGYIRLDELEKWIN